MTALVWSAAGTVVGVLGLLTTLLVLWLRQGQRTAEERTGRLIAEVRTEIAEIRATNVLTDHRLTRLEDEARGQRLVLPER